MGPRAIGSAVPAVGASPAVGTSPAASAPDDLAFHCFPVRHRSPDAQQAVSGLLARPTRCARVGVDGIADECADRPSLLGGTALQSAPLLWGKKDLRPLGVHVQTITCATAVHEGNQMVELGGLEPPTPCMPCRCSPS